MRRSMGERYGLAQEKQCGSADPGPANRQLRPPLARARRDLPLPKPIKGAILVSKVPGICECQLRARSAVRR